MRKFSPVLGHDDHIKFPRLHALDIHPNGNKCPALDILADGVELAAAFQRPHAIKFWRDFLGAFQRADGIAQPHIQVRREIGARPGLKAQ